MRKSYGEGRIYIVSPAFFLHALDTDTGVPIANFGENGTIDLLANFGYEYHPTDGLPADAPRARARARTGVRRHQRRTPVEVQRHPAVRE